MNVNKNEIILISDYGRSAQGWLSYMLCYVFNAKYIEPYCILSGTKFTERENILQNTSGNLEGREKTGINYIVKTHGYPDKNQFNLTQNVLYLTRDPRDVAISYFFLNRKWFKDGNRSVRVLVNRIPIFCYLYVAFTWRKHAQKWIGYYKYHVRYEDLRKDTKNTLTSILNNFSTQINLSLINEAIDIFSFERSYGRKRGEEDINNPEARKGLIGDYKKHFSRFTNLLFWNICGKEAERFGYLKDGTTTLEPIQVELS